MNNLNKNEANGLINMHINKKLNQPFLIIIFAIYTRCQWMKVEVRCSKLECRGDIPI